LALVVGGAVLLMPALVILLQAAVAALNERAGLSAPISALVVGGAALVLGLILLLIGVSRLKIENMMPNRTIQQLKRDASVAQDQVRTSHEQNTAARTRSRADARAPHRRPRRTARVHDAAPGRRPGRGLRQHRHRRVPDES